MLRQPLLFHLLVAMASSFFIYPLFSTQSVRPPLATYPWLCSTCHTIGHQVLPTPAFKVILQHSVRYGQVFRSILYFQSSSWQSDSRLCPNPSPCLGQRRIFLGVRDILGMCLRSHTKSTSHQKRYIGRFYLRARAHHSQNIKLHRELVLWNASSENICFLRGSNSFRARWICLEASFLTCSATEPYRLW